MQIQHHSAIQFHWNNCVRSWVCVAANLTYTRTRGRSSGGLLFKSLQSDIELSENCRAPQSHWRGTLLVTEQLVSSLACYLGSRPGEDRTLSTHLLWDVDIWVCVLFLYIHRQRKNTMKVEIKNYHSKDMLSPVLSHSEHTYPSSVLLSEAALEFPFLSVRVKCGQTYSEHHCPSSGKADS